MDQAFRVADLALKLKVTRSTIYGLIKEGRLHSIRLGQANIRIPSTSLQSFLSACTEKPTPYNTPLVLFNPEASLIRTLRSEGCVCTVADSYYHLGRAHGRSPLFPTLVNVPSGSPEIASQYIATLGIPPDEIAASPTIFVTHDEEAQRRLECLKVIHAVPFELGSKFVRAVYDKIHMHLVSRILNVDQNGLKYV